MTFGEKNWNHKHIQTKPPGSPQNNNNNHRNEKKLKKNQKTKSKEEMFGTKLLRLICGIWSTQAAAFRNSRMFEIWCLSFLSYKT